MKYKAWTVFLAFVMLLNSVPVIAHAESLLLNDPGWKVSNTVDEAYYEKMREIHANDRYSILWGIQLTDGSNVATINDKETVFPTAPWTQDGKIWVSISEIAEALGEGSIFGYLDLEQYKTDYVALDDVVEALALEAEYSEDGSTVTLTAPFQTARLLVSTKEKLNTELLGARDAVFNGVFMWVLQFDTPAKAKAAWEMLDAAGIPAEPDEYVRLITPVFPTPKVFADVDPSSWYAPYVDYVSARHIFDGTPTGFEPNALMTRAMVAQLLYNLMGSKKPVEAGTFRDVNTDNWFFSAVSWTSATGIMTGDNGVFCPNDAVTRQDLITALCRYAKYQYRDYDASVIGDLSRWSDADSISDYAKDTMAWAVGVGIIEGKDGKLAPRDFATRAEVAAMMTRFYKATHSVA